VPEATVCPPSVVADTRMQTMELKVTITDTAVDEKVTTIFYALAGAELDLLRQRVQQQTLAGAVTPVTRCMASRASPAPAFSCSPRVRLTGWPPGSPAELSEGHRGLRRSEPALRQEGDDQADRLDTPRRASRIGRDRQLGHTLWRRRDDILAFFDHHASNGPAEPHHYPGAHCYTAEHSIHSSTHSELRRASKLQRPRPRFPTIRGF
jgi:hypothetical protein